MKNIYIFITFIVMAVYSFANADQSVDLNTSANANQTLVGGIQSITFNSGKSTDVMTYRNYIQVHPNIELPIPPRTMYVKDIQVWREEIKISCQKLSSIDKIESLMKKTGDIFQPASQIFLCLEQNQDPIKLLTELPKTKSDDNLGSFSYDSGKNCYLKTAIIRALSIAKAKTMTRRVLVRYHPMLNPVNTGTSFGNSNGLSGIEGTTAWAFAPGAQFGKSESMVYIRWKIYVDCYNDGPVVVSKSSQKKPNNLSAIFFNDNGFDSSAIQKNIEWLGRRWPEIKKRNLAVEFIGLGIPEYGIANSEQIAHIAMTKIGTNLVVSGIPATELEKSFIYKSDVINKTSLINQIKNKGWDGFVKINIKKNN